MTERAMQRAGGQRGRVRLGTAGTYAKPQRIITRQQARQCSACGNLALGRTASTPRRLEHAPSGVAAWIARVGKVPIALSSLVVGALVPWAVNAYAPKAVEQISDTPVLDIAVGYDSSAYSDGWAMSLPTAAHKGDVGKEVDGCNSFRLWAVGVGAADVEQTFLTLTFRGTTIDPVAVTGIRVVIDSRAEPYAVTQMSCPSAGANSSQRAVVNLDEPDPVFRVQNEDGTAGAPWFRQNQLTLSKGEIVTFAVEAWAFKAAYTWHMEAIVRTAEGQQVVPISGSYGTTGLSSSYTTTLEWDWSKVPPRLIERSGNVT